MTKLAKALRLREMPLKDLVAPAKDLVEKFDEAMSESEARAILAERQRLEALDVKLAAWKQRQHEAKP